MGVSDLKHTIVPVKSGGEVIILDNGAVIKAEAEAMLQALHSRSTGGLKEHLAKLTKGGADKFMDQFYVGYGHKSIGDCGSSTAFIEGVSLLVAKAIQDFPLYSGQESSTRYVDFSRQPLIDPTNSPEGRDLLEMQRAFYLEAQGPTRQHLRNQFPQEGEDARIYEKAINARSFDITRGLLPAGAATNLAWHTNLRQAADRALFLRHHPLEEVRDVAEALETAFQKAHPNSFNHKRYEATEQFQDTIANGYFFHNPDSPLDPVVSFDGINRAELEKHRTLINERPPKAELPKYLAQAGNLAVEFQLDFGSFRDIQRHRAINQRMPLLTRELGFNNWYTENLAPEVRDRLQTHLEDVGKRIESLRVSPTEAQYFTPIGYNTSNRFTGDIPATVYMVELRDSRFVHPTLQKVAHSIGDQITDVLGVPLHVDKEPGRFDERRGTHDIEEK